MYGTCSSQRASAVCDLGGIPIDYRHLDFVKEIHRVTSEGVDVVFDGIGGPHMWRSRKALRPGGKVVVYGLTSSLSNPGSLQSWLSLNGIGKLSDQWINRIIESPNLRPLRGGPETNRPNRLELADRD
jgi:NADPH:quinone reductase-like Zn-dependent oxidoreductase